MKAKREITGRIVVKAAEVVSRAVEEGINMGWSRAHKHSDKPGEDHIKTCLERSIMDALYEVLIFDGDP